MSMNSHPAPERHDPLLDAVLRDENWESASAGLKIQALRTFQTRRRIRSLVRWTACAAVLAAALIAAVHWLGRADSAPSLMAVGSSSVPSTPPRARYMTDQELLASFPKGSASWPRWTAKRCWSSWTRTSSGPM